MIFELFLWNSKCLTPDLIGRASFSLRVQRNVWRHFHFVLEFRHRYTQPVDICYFILFCYVILFYFLFYKTNRTWLLRFCAVIETWMTPFQPEKMRENTGLRLVFPLGIFAGWNDVIHVSISTAQRNVSIVLFVKYLFCCIFPNNNH